MPKGEVNSAKTRCPAGHSYSERGVVRAKKNGKTYRLCLECKRLKTIENRGGLKGNYNAQKTHCEQGHPLEGENLRLVPGGRACRTCDGWSNRSIEQKEEYKKARRLTRPDKQKMALDYLGGECVDCGYNENPRGLQFDHVRGVKSCNVGTMFICRSWEAVKEELDKCELRCGTCHAIKTSVETEQRNALKRSD